MRQAPALAGAPLRGRSSAMPSYPSYRGRSIHSFGPSCNCNCVQSGQAIASRRKARLWLDPFWVLCL